MKKRTMIIGVLMALFAMSSVAQDAFAKDIMKMMEVNGSAATQDMVFKQLKQQMQMQAQMKNAPQEVWDSLYTDVFKVELADLNSKLIPIYKKHFTHQEVKEMIAFYETPVGKKLATETPAITQESMQMSQMWAMGLMKKMNDFMANKGYGFKSIN